MIANLKPYPAYKDSGVPWVEEIPEHWHLAPNRSLVRPRKTLVGHLHAEYRLLSLTKEGIIVRDVERGKGKFSADMGAFQEVRDGDLVFCLFDVPETPRTVGLSHHHGMITGAYTVFECSNPVLSVFLDHFYRAMDDRKLLSPLYSGLRNTIPLPRFLAAKTPVPSPVEQITIVRLLEHADRRIRRYIRTKQKLIALLNEQKQAIIHQVVTKGLDPNVKIKPSGVEWLGEVPEHWEVRKLKFEMTFSGGGTPSKANAEYWSGTIPWVSPKDMKTHLVTDAEDHITEQAVAESSTKLVLPNSVLMVVRSGILQRTIPTALCGGVVALNQDMKALTTKGRLHPEFFIAFVRGYEPMLLAEWTKQGATVESIEHQFLANSVVPIPPAEEQQDILNSIRQSTVEDTQAIAIAQREISLLKEYRTRLIADVVTGKLDVRETVANLPDEMDESDGISEVDALDEIGERLDDLDIAEEAISAD